VVLATPPKYRAMPARSLALALLLLLCAMPAGWAAEPAGATVVLQLPRSMSPDQVKGLIADLAAKGVQPTAPAAQLFRWRAFGCRMIFTAIMFGAYTVFSEWLNVEIRRSWSYAAAMPVFPWLGTGLTLLQWLVVPGLAFAIINYRNRARRRQR
jgi:hypothetical protein